MELKHETLWPIVHARLREYMAASSWNIDLIARLTGSTSETVTGWLGTSEPSGERLIKLWHVLAAVGLESPEMEQLKPSNHLCGQLLTFGQMTIQELRDVIGVKDVQAVLRMLRGTEPMRWTLSRKELDELYGDQLNEALSSLPQLSASKPPRPSRKQQSSHVAPPSSNSVDAGVVSSMVSMSSEPTLLAAVLLNAAAPLVRYFDSDKSSPEERSRLRELMGQDGMFELSTHFNRLCSERARNTGR